MKSQGIGWVKRKVMAKASITLHIDHDESTDILKVKTKLPLGMSIDQSLKLDGTEVELKSPLGDRMKVIPNWKDDTKQCMRVKTNNLDTNKKSVMERIMPTPDTMQDTVINADNIKMVRHFKKVK